MFFVGAVLYLNGMWLLGKADSKPVGFFNLLVGVLITVLAVNNHFRATTMAEHLGAANGLLFGFTYLMVAGHCLLDHSGRALGWFSLFVAIATVPNSLMSYVNGDVRFAIIWFMWGFLWFMFFLTQALGNEKVRWVPYLSIFIGLVSAGIPGYMILWEAW